MFETYSLHQIAIQQKRIISACTSCNGIIITLQKYQQITIHHVYDMTDTIDLTQRLKNEQKFAYNNCYGMVNLPQQDVHFATFAIVLDAAVCVVSISLIEFNQKCINQSEQSMNEEHPPTKRLNIETINVIKCKKYITDHERFTKAKLISLRNNELFLSLDYKHRVMGGILVIKFDKLFPRLEFSVMELHNLSFNNQKDDVYIEPDDLVKLNPRMSLLWEYIAIYSQIEHQSYYKHFLLLYQLPKQSDMKRVETVPKRSYTLFQQQSQNVLLKYVYGSIIQGKKESLESRRITLFCQRPEGLSLMEIDLQQPIKLKKTIFYPNLILYEFIRTSTTPAQLEKRGNTLCQRNELFLLHCRKSLLGKDTLVLLASASNKHAGLANELVLQDQLQKIDVSSPQPTVVFPNHLTRLRTISKAAIYHSMLLEMRPQIGRGFAAFERTVCELLF